MFTTDHENNAVIAAFYMEQIFLEFEERFWSDELLGFASSDGSLRAEYVPFLLVDVSQYFGKPVLAGYIRAREVRCLVCLVFCIFESLARFRQWIAKNRW